MDLLIVGTKTLNLNMDRAIIKERYNSIIQDVIAIFQIGFSAHECGDGAKTIGWSGGFDHRFEGGFAEIVIELGERSLHLYFRRDDLSMFLYQDSDGHFWKTNDFLGFEEAHVLPFSSSYCSLVNTANQDLGSLNFDLGGFTASFHNILSNDACRKARGFLFFVVAFSESWKFSSIAKLVLQGLDSQVGDEDSKVPTEVSTSCKRLNDQAATLIRSWNFFSGHFLNEGLFNQVVDRGIAKEELKVISCPPNYDMF